VLPVGANCLGIPRMRIGTGLLWASRVATGSGGTGSVDMVLGEAGGAISKGAEPKKTQSSIHISLRIIFLSPVKGWEFARSPDRSRIRYRLLPPM